MGMGMGMGMGIGMGKGLLMRDEENDTQNEIIKYFTHFTLDYSLSLYIS